MALSFFMGTVATIAGSAPEKKEAPEDVSEFVEIPPISVAMYNKRKRPAGTMTVLLQLKIDDTDQRAEARKVMPRLKNAYMQETLKLALNFFDINRPVNANILGRSLQNVTNGVLKHDKARVLIGNIAVHKR
jgi:hypothetical protein|tara:strand:+ start:185026 stop:185421 length:396 start_codon:yes stop_codon:yes gene_type:complete